MTVTAAEARARWDELLDLAESEPVLITREGRPPLYLTPETADVAGNHDLDDVLDEGLIASLEEGVRQLDAGQGIVLQNEAEIHRYFKELTTRVLAPRSAGAERSQCGFRPSPRLTSRRLALTSRPTTLRLR